MGFAERIDLLENDAKHNYNPLQRQGVIRWMARWLLKRDELITEPAIELLSDKEIQCTPEGQVMRLSGARSTYELNRDYEKKLAERREKLWETQDHAKLLDRVREIAGIRPLRELPQPRVVNLEVLEQKGYRIRKMIVTPEGGVHLPALLFDPGSAGRTVLYVHEEGKQADAAPGGPIDDLIEEGRRVLAVDLRGTGETQPGTRSNLSGATGPDWKEVFTAYLLGRSYVGMRAEDILICARYLKQQHGRPVELIAIGNVGVPALHAAALEPELFTSVKLTRALNSWSNVIELGRSVNQQVNAVHGALTTYDLPDLARTLGDKLTVQEPLNALGEPAIP
jgi:hypothetical protein